ncbi:K(+)-transporting ATPase subunit F [Thioclava sp. BHET1]|nr:K(+)-transporting ATPase subunit F [Thioclava sp. BHET1]
MFEMILGLAVTAGIFCFLVVALARPDWF